jgi:hypothetical protein
MDMPRLWSRSVGALAALAAATAFASSQAHAAPLRTATTTDYSTAQYLQRELGLPASTADTIEPVTYDRFQWLLGHADGRLAILIGDPAQDASFDARAQDTAAAAKAAGAAKVYWFNPNLSGSVTVDGVAQPNLDIRNPAGITSLAAASQQKYDHAWRALIGLHLGNGLQITRNNVDASNQTVTVTVDAGVVNDAGASPLFDYTGGTAPANVQDSFFLVYDKDRTVGGSKAKIVAWTDLTTQAGSSAAQSAVTAAIDVAGASSIVAVDQFHWWKSAANAKQVAQAPAANRGSGHPVVTNADDEDGWRVNQITYPQLVDLLEHGGDDANAVILLGGTWCPNTRAVLPNVNEYAQQNDVTVFNFDTVLDGAQVGGTATSATNPLQTRNTQNNGSTTPQRANPSFLYGAVVDGYLDNIKTEYDPAGSSNVTYYPGGNPAASLVTTNKLQVPFLFGYQQSASGDGVRRQWIIDNGNGTYKEYMSNWWLANPRPGQLDLGAIPAGAPIWSTIDEQLRGATWQTDPATVQPNTGTDADADRFLVAEDTATVTYNAPSGGNPASISIANGGSVAIGPAALSAALSALGSSAPANLAGARAALIAAEQATPRDAALVGHLRTVTGAWGVAQSRKTTLITRWGNATTPNSILGGLAAVHALDVFFGGLPGGVLSRRTVTADPVVQGTAPTISVTIANDHGRVPTGDVSLVVKQGGATVATASQPVTGGAASFTLPALGAGTYDYALSYAGDDQIAAFTESGRLTVAPAPEQPGPPDATPPTVPVIVTPTPPASPAPSAPLRKVGKVRSVVVKAPTRRKGGRYKVTISVPKGASPVAGRVTIKLRKGAVTKTVTGRLSRGAATVKLPKLAKGTWRVTVSWPGDSRYAKVSTAGARIKVTT